MNTLETSPQPAPDHGILPAPAPVTSPELSPVPQLSTLNSQPAAEPSCKRHRTGRVARLPKEIRSRINQMLDDGFPYLQIIQNLGESAGPLTEKCIRSWKNGGYQDYLRDQQLLDEARIRSEFLTDFVREDPSIDTFQAAHKLAAALICRAIAEFGSQTFHDAVKANPLNLLRMLNALSRITAGGLKCQRFLAEEAERLAKSAPETQNHPGVAANPVGLTEPAVAELNHRLNLM